MRLFGLLRRIMRRWRRAPASIGPLLLPAPAARSPKAPTTATGLRFRPQICCETRQIASLMVVPPQHMDGDADATLRAALNQHRIWVAAGLQPPPLMIELPPIVAEAAELAQPLIWEIDRQDFPTSGVIFSAPSPGRYLTRLGGLALLSRQGCGIELDCLDPLGMALIRDLKPQGARMRVPPGLLPPDSQDPRRGQVILSLLALAERHGLTTLVDDVKSREDYDYLAQLGFNFVQGDGVSPIQDATATAQMLRKARPEIAQPVLFPRPAA